MWQVVYEDEWKELIKYMYDHDDAIQLIERVLMFIREQVFSQSNTLINNHLYGIAKASIFR